MSLIEGKVGPVISSDGTTGSSLRQTKDASVAVQDAHGRYVESGYRNGLYIACNQAAVTFGVGLSTTVATLSLSNDLNSGRILAIHQVSFAFSAAPAAATMIALAGLNATSNVTHTTPVVVRNAWQGGPVLGVGKADSAATLPTVPVYLLPIVAVTAAAAIAPPFSAIDLGGSIAVLPGGYVAFQATAAAAGFCGIVWEEILI